jgi:hypothetical protein
VSARERPVGRLRVVVALLALTALVLTIGAGLGLLRHDDQLGAAAPPVEVADPRVPVDCPEPTPREGLERDEEPAPLVEEGQVEAPIPAEVEIPVGSAVLLGCPQVFDGRRVVYRGEAVGQVLGRGTRVWLQVNDDIYAGAAGPLPGHRVFAGMNGGLGISLTASEAARLTARGGPGRRGDQVAVRGIFQRVDPASGEVAVIVADALEVIEEGGPHPVEAPTDRAIVAYVLLSVAVVLGVVQRHARRR